MQNEEFSSVIHFFFSTQLLFGQACLHPVSGESAAESGRREAALSAARLLNTAEVAFHNKSGAYGTADQLLQTDFVRRHKGEISQLNLSGAGEIVPGFELSIFTSSAGYVLLLNDRTDPCKFRYFSSQEGIIFEGISIDQTRRASSIARRERHIANAKSKKE